MSIKTKHKQNKATKKNRRVRLTLRQRKTRSRPKFGGAEETPPESPSKKKGVVEMISTGLSDAAKSTASAATTLGLRAVGLQPVDDGAPNPDSQRPSDDSPSIISKVNETGGILLDRVNQVIGSDDFQGTITAAAEDTGAIIADTAKNFNERMNTPEARAQVEEAVGHASEVASVVAEAAKEPLEKAADTMSAAVSKASSGIATGAVKVLRDAAMAIPGVATLVEPVRIVDDLSRAAGTVVEAGTDATEAMADMVAETSDSTKQKLHELAQKKKESSKIRNRVNDSLQEFGAARGGSTQLCHMRTRKRVRFSAQV